MSMQGKGAKIYDRPEAGNDTDSNRTLGMVILIVAVLAVGTICFIATQLIGRLGS